MINNHINRSGLTSPLNPTFKEVQRRCKRIPIEIPDNSSNLDYHFSFLISRLSSFHRFSDSTGIVICVVSHRTFDPITIMGELPISSRFDPLCSS